MTIFDLCFLVALGALVGIGWILDAESRKASASAPDGISPSGPVQ